MYGAKSERVGGRKVANAFAHGRALRGCSGEGRKLIPYRNPKDVKASKTGLTAVFLKSSTLFTHRIMSSDSEQDADVVEVGQVPYFH